MDLLHERLLDEHHATIHGYEGGRHYAETNFAELTWRRRDNERGKGLVAGLATGFLTMLAYGLVSQEIELPPLLGPFLGVFGLMFGSELYRRRNRTPPVSQELQRHLNEHGEFYVRYRNLVEGLRRDPETVFRVEYANLDLEQEASIFYDVLDDCLEDGVQPVHSYFLDRISRSEHSNIYFQRLAARLKEHERPLVVAKHDLSKYDLGA